MQIQDQLGGMDMSTISLTAIPAGIETRSNDYAFKAIVAFCCVGLFVSFALMAYGIELNAGPM
jgi:hypothetical protein